MRCIRFGSRRISQFGARFHHVPAFPPLDSYARRHIGPQQKDVAEMLKDLGKTSLDELSSEIVPKDLQFSGDMWDDDCFSESDLLAHMQDLAGQNKVLKSFLGYGYSNTKTPSVLVRNMLESPGWYTPYTPYQAEIAQGRLQSLLNYQTMISDLTGLPVANASLLDEGTAVGECIAVSVTASKHSRMKFFIDMRCHPQTIEVAKTRAVGLGVELVVGDYRSFTPDAKFGGVCVQYPDTFGAVNDYGDFFAKAKAVGALSVCAADILALCTLRPPGEFGADLCVGSTQRFGVPLGYGGPHAAFLACSSDMKRIIPGRIIGVSRDANGQRCLRMALQTREQHIRREKAISNICTAQALLANIAAMFAVYHGPEGLKEIAGDVHLKAKTLAHGLQELGHTVSSEVFFDTLQVELKGMESATYVSRCLERGINIRSENSNVVVIALDETTTGHDLVDLLEAAGMPSVDVNSLHAKAVGTDIISSHTRTSPFLAHQVFNSYQGETEMMRYLNRLEKQDLGLQTAMIPLGSCTMKLNAASAMLPITYPGFSQIHPFVPLDQAAGYQQLISKLEQRLIEITGLDNCCMQPNAGAQGEYTGLSCIRAYHQSRGDHHRDVCLVPVSAHGTNPATVSMTGMKLVLVKCDVKGNVDVDDLKQKAEDHSANLAALMITYPSTHGVFESSIKDICDTIHANGGQVYMDGANLNAQTGLCRPGDIGADCVHFNLHKTFSIPHGGGGPGMGPICIRSQLAPFMPNHCVVPNVGGSLPIGGVSSAPWGSAGILPISYAYIEMMGSRGLKMATQCAILSANYLRHHLNKDYPVLYTDEHGYCAHEFILDVRPLKQTAGVEAEDIAKRLMDFNFHAPTVSFPVVGTMMIEPTESESKFELDRFIEAMSMIREEIREIADGRADKKNNVLKNAPHPAHCLVAEWNFPYSREKAVYPTAFVRENKHWPTVARIDNVWGDRHFQPTIEVTQTVS